MKYIDVDKLNSEIERRMQENAGKALFLGADFAGRTEEDNEIKNFIDSLQQDLDVIELSFNGGTYRINGEEKTFKGGTAKVAILELIPEESCSN